MEDTWIIRILNDPEEGAHFEYFEFKLTQALKSFPKDLLWKITLGKLQSSNEIVQIKATSILDGSKEEKIFTHESLTQEIRKILSSLGWVSPLAELEYINESEVA